MICQSHRKSGVITVCSFPRYLWRGVVCMPASRGPVSHFCADMSTGMLQLAGVSHELARLACRHRPTGGFKARACGVGLAGFGYVPLLVAGCVVLPSTWARQSVVSYPLLTHAGHSRECARACGHCGDALISLGGFVGWMCSNLQACCITPAGVWYITGICVSLCNSVIIDH